MEAKIALVVSSVSRPSRSRGSTIGWCAWAALLVALTMVAYLPAFRGGFIFDDNVLLTDNPLIRARDGLWRFWFAATTPDYWPVTSSTLWLEWRLWGLNAAGYHATNVALHLAEVFLLWALLRRLQAPGAGLAALLFAVHPLNAESVVWIAQRKNLMAMLFYLLSLLAFVQAEDTGKSRYRWLSLTAFALALLAKGSVVMLPLVLVGVILWRRRPNGRDWARLLPFFLVAAGLAAVEARYSTVEAFASSAGKTFPDRLAGAGAALWFYAGKAVWPAHLLFIYPSTTASIANPLSWAPLAAAVAFTAVLFRLRGDSIRRLRFGWGYFCVSLVPVLGFADVGFMRFTPVSDHYAHLALIGVAALAGWACAKAFHAGRVPRMLAVAAAAGVIALFTLQTRSQCRMYADAETLYRDTLAANPSCWMADNNLGAVWLAAGRLPDAVSCFETALRLNPEDAETNNNLGLAFSRIGRTQDAVARYEEALRLRPGFYQAENNLGVALARSGRLREAIGHFEAALQMEPDYREAQLNLRHARSVLPH